MTHTKILPCNLDSCNNTYINKIFARVLCTSDKIYNLANYLTPAFYQTLVLILIIHSKIVTIERGCVGFLKKIIYSGFIVNFGFVQSPTRKVDLVLQSPLVPCPNNDRQCECLI